MRCWLPSYFVAISRQRQASSCRRHDGGQFLQHTPAQFVGSDRQAQALVVAQAQPLASELFTQDPVLFLKVIEGILLPLVHPASKGNQ